MTAMASQRRRAFCFSRVWGSQHGGSFYSQRLLHELSDRGWEVTVLAEQFEQPATHGIPLRGFFKTNPAAWARKLSELLALFRLITTSHQAAVIVQGDVPRVSYLLMQFLVPLVFIRQDGILTCPGNNRFLPLSRLVCRRSLGWSCLSVHRKEGCLRGVSWLHRLGRVGYRVRDRILLHRLKHFVVNSHYIQRAHARPARVLYPPRIENVWPPIEVRRDLKRLIFCARLEPVKGAADAIEILKLLPPDYHLDVLGDGCERTHLMRSVAEHHLVDRVKFHGWVDAVTRDNTLRRASVLLMPSTCDEAFGMVGLEAFAQGTPVVAYDVGGISEWCREGAGILVPCGDVSQAAAAVLQLTQNPSLWRTYSAAALRLAKDYFPPNRFGQELDALLAEVLATGATHRGTQW